MGMEWTNSTDAKWIEFTIQEQDGWFQIVPLEFETNSINKTEWLEIIEKQGD